MFVDGVLYGQKLADSALPRIGLNIVGGLNATVFILYWSSNLASVD